MEKYENIKKAIRENAEKLKAAEAEFNGLKWSEKRAEARGLILAENITVMKITAAILNDNARRAYVAETLPKIAQIWNKYAGKAYGPKTREKIRDEIKSACACGFYLSSGYTGAACRDLNLAPLDARGFTEGARYDDFKLYTEYNAPAVDDENKIQKINPDALRLSRCAEYVENVAERVQAIREAFDRVQAGLKALNGFISEYGKIIPAGIESINAVYGIPSALNVKRI